MVGATVKWCLGRRQLAHTSASKLHCDYLQVSIMIMLMMMILMMIMMLNMLMKNNDNDPPVHLRATPSLKSSWEAVLQVNVKSTNILRKKVCVKSFQPPNTQ